MNDELIKRIDEQMKAIKPYDKNGYRSADFDIHALLYDCRAALSRKYVPMTDDELHCVWVESGNLNATETMRMVEAEVIRRAGLEVEE